MITLLALTALSLTPLLLPLEFPFVPLPFSTGASGFSAAEVTSGWEILAGPPELGGLPSSLESELRRWIGFALLSL